MALSITQSCIACYACKEVCPSKAITSGDKQFAVIAHRCDECANNVNGAQCAQICPVENAIVDANGCALNPPGSLTGLPQEANVIALS
ncbi:4Fe-4S dicluster domain-containing protein [Agarivorans sp. JK6]|uniref:4Fe-4S dicluster domain-containing protein n=1 Tax=Agarivorans sp. JK6 TaxID=2997426 RepID=UPI003872D5C1